MRWRPFDFTTEISQLRPGTFVYSSILIFIPYHFLGQNETTSKKAEWMENIIEKQLDAESACSETMTQETQDLGQARRA